MCAVSLLKCSALLEEVGLRGWPKTSGSRGMHVNVRIEPRWTFAEVRRAAIALSRAVERRAPALASSKWWKEERHGVFLDYNQNAKDRTTCSAYSVRPLPDARVSTPLHWHEVPDCDPADFTLFTIPERFAKIGDPHADMDAAPGSLEKLLELAAKDEAAGLGDAPWPPHFRKMEGEGPRVAPSRAKPAVKKPRMKMPLIVVANSPDKAAALAGLERWKSKHARVADFLAIDDVLVDSMRGRSSTWTRIRVNLRHVPEALRPPQETPDPDDDPTREWREWRKNKRDQLSASDLATVRKNLCQLLRRNDLELGISAVARLLVGSPSAKLRHMAEAALPACAHKRPPPPVRVALVPMIGPCLDSIGSDRLACDWRLSPVALPCSAQSFHG